jgi:hypothetical protein
MNKPDYVHMRNLIMNAVEKITTESSMEEISDNYGELIDFLESMYVASILSLTGSLLAVAKRTPDESAEYLRAVRVLMEQPQMLMQTKLMKLYHEMITAMDLPDAFQVKTHNEEVAEEIINECEKVTT